MIIQHDFMNCRLIKQSNIADKTHQSPYTLYSTLQICPASLNILLIKIVAFITL